jgi:hypothetical protein
MLGQWFIYIILATQEAEIRRITVQSQLWANSSGDPILKNQSQKRAGGMAQEAECLSSKYKALNSNSSAATHTHTHTHKP